MNRQELKQKFKTGSISKSEYIDAMFEQNKALFDYMHLLEGTDIASIEITKDGVVFSSKQDGIKIICEKPDKRTAPFEIMNFDSYESQDAGFLFKLIKDGDIVFDIGANIGWYSISLSKHFPHSTICSFEPLKNTYENLKRNVSFNKAANIRLHQFGFSDRNAVLTFYSSPDTSVSNSAKNITGEEHAIPVECEVKKMDEFIKLNNLSVDFIKCDVEGAELFVYQGAIETLNQFKPIVFTEMLRKWSAKFSYHPNDIIHLFADLGYYCFYTNVNQLVKVDKVSETTEATNFFFLHSEKHNQIIKNFTT